VIEKAGIPFRLALPHVAFNRKIGEFSRIHADPEGRMVDAGTFAANRDRWLPSTDDDLYITGLMKPVDQAGAYASWIAAPKVGIDNKPGHFEYVKIWN
jgi:benzoyl-CoA 2,3-dioxygenase component B